MNNSHVKSLERLLELQSISTNSIGIPFTVDDDKEMESLKQQILDNQEIVQRLKELTSKRLCEIIRESQYSAHLDDGYDEDIALDILLKSILGNNNA